MNAITVGQQYEARVVGRSGYSIRVQLGDDGPRADLHISEVCGDSYEAKVENFNQLTSGTIIGVEVIMVGGERPRVSQRLFAQRKQQ